MGQLTGDRIMHVLPFTLVALFLWGLSAPSYGEPTPPSYAWKEGPAEVTLGEQAMLKLPAGYSYLGQKDTQRALKDMGNFPSGTELALVTGAGDQAQWFVVIRFIDAGYVADDDAADWDADAMLASMKEGTEAANEKRKQMGIAPITVRGWEEKPRYDKQSNKVVWAVSSQEQNGVGVNYNTLTLGRHGYISMNMVGSLEDLPQLKPHTNVLLTNLNFVDGKRYTDFDSTTDKVAAVGLAALIAGAAFKSGLLAKLLLLVVAFKKVIIIGIIALAALLTRIFKKKPAPVS
jgi:uncharacterized membrane-anchored protein